MRRLKRICRGGIQVVLILLIFLNMGIMIFQYGNENDLLEGIPFGVIEVTGGSMEPYLSPGDGIFVYEVPFERLRTQDTILFMQSGSLVTHRIQEVGEDYVITKGTANDVEDTPVYKEDYRAKVIFSIPYLNVILVFYENPIYFVLFAVMLFFFMFGGSLAAELYEKIEEMRRLSPPEQDMEEKF